MLLYYLFIYFQNPDHLFVLLVMTVGCHQYHLNNNLTCSTNNSNTLLEKQRKNPCVGQYMEAVTALLCYFVFVDAGWLQ